MTSESCVQCHNTHPDKTWGDHKWNVGDSRGVLEVITPIEEELMAHKEMWKTIKSGKPWSGDLKNRAKDGSVYYVHTTIIPAFNTEGELVEYISFREDITEKVLAEQRLEEERKLNQIILDNQEEVLLLATKKSGVINVNTKFFTTFNFKSLNDFKESHKCICELFIDISMPSINIGEMVEYIREGNESLPILALAEQSVETELIDITAYLHKPLALEPF